MYNSRFFKYTCACAQPQGAEQDYLSLSLNVWTKIQTGKKKQLEKVTRPKCYPVLFKQGSRSKYAGARSTVPNKGRLAHNNVKLLHLFTCIIAKIQACTFCMFYYSHVLLFMAFVIV